MMNMKMFLSQFVSNTNVTQMRLMKVIYTMKNSMIQEFQYSFQFQFLMIPKNFESICDGEYQSENRFQSQRFHSLIQLRLMTKSHRQIQNHRWIEHFAELQLIGVMNYKIVLIQFVLSVNLIQMWLMKVGNNMQNILIQDFCLWRRWYDPTSKPNPSGVCEKI
jgi:hypothetical protein